MLFMVHPPCTGRRPTRRCSLIRALAAVDRVAGKNSAYGKQAHAIVDQRGYVGYVARHIVGVVESLRVDVASPSLRSGSRR